MKNPTSGLIVTADLDDPRVLGLLEQHVEAARADVPLSSDHTLEAGALREPGIDIWAYWSANDLLGFAALKELALGHGEIKSMHVAEAKRRTGVGTALLRHIIAEARRRGMKRLSLETGSAEKYNPARALYRAHGFSECGPFGGYAPDPHNVFMSLDL